MGDTKVGSGVNIGAGTITANYNSITKEKKQTIINDGASIGSNTVLVAPVELGEKAFIAAGSVITKDVGANSLGLTRSPQKEIKTTLSKKENKMKLGLETMPAREKMCSPHMRLNSFAVVQIRY